MFVCIVMDYYKLGEIFICVFAQLFFIRVFMNLYYLFKFIINPFVPNAPFLHRMKTSESYGFQAVEKGCIENEWVKMISVKFTRCMVFLK